MRYAYEKTLILYRVSAVAMIMVVMLPDPFREMGAWKNSTETRQSGHALRFGPEVKMEVVPKNGAPERLRCGTIQNEASWILQRVFRRHCKNFPSILTCIGKRTSEGCDRGSEVWTIRLTGTVLLYKVILPYQPILIDSSTHYC